MNRGSKPGKYLGKSVRAKSTASAKALRPAGSKNSKCQEGLRSKRETRRRRWGGGLVARGDGLGLNAKCDGKPSRVRQRPLLHQNSSSVRARSLPPCVLSPTQCPTRNKHHRNLYGMSQLINAASFPYPATLTKLNVDTAI